MRTQTITEIIEKTLITFNTKMKSAFIQSLLGNIVMFNQLPLMLSIEYLFSSLLTSGTFSLSLSRLDTNAEITTRASVSCAFKNLL